MLASLFFRRPFTVSFESGGGGWPRVSVCISLYDYAEFIGNTLASVFNQTLAELGLVVVDDCSTDGSHDMALQWIDRNHRRFARCLLLRHKTNSGLSESRNTAIRYCKSPYIFILDSDNLLYPRCVQRCYETLIETDGAFAYPILERFGEEKALFNIQSWDPALLARGNYIDAMALVRREAWERVGGYSEMGGLGMEDYDFWCKLHLAGDRGVHVPEILARYRVHARSMTSTITSTSSSRAILKQIFSERYPGLCSDSQRQDPTDGHQDASTCKTYTRGE